MPGVFVHAGEGNQQRAGRTGGRHRQLNDSVGQLPLHGQIIAAAALLMQRFQIVALAGLQIDRRGLLVGLVIKHFARRSRTSPNTAAFHRPGFHWCSTARATCRRWQSKKYIRRSSAAPPRPAAARRNYPTRYSVAFQNWCRCACSSAEGLPGQSGL